MAYNSGQLRGKIRLYVNNGFFGVPYSQTNPYVIHDEYVGWWESNHKWDKIGTLISSTNWIDVFITLDLHPAPQKENKKHTQKKKKRASRYGGFPAFRFWFSMPTSKQRTRPPEIFHPAGNACGNLIMQSHCRDTWWLIPLSKWVITPIMWINPTYPIYNWGYNPLTKWDEPPSSHTDFGWGKGDSHHADLGNFAVMTWTSKVSMDDFGGRTSSFTYWLFNGTPLFTNQLVRTGHIWSVLHM